MKKMISIIIASVLAIGTFVVAPVVYTSGTFANSDNEQTFGYSRDIEMLGSVESDKEFGYTRDIEMLG